MKVLPMDYLDRADRIAPYTIFFGTYLPKVTKKNRKHHFFFKRKKLHLQFRSLEDYEHLVNEPARSGWALFFFRNFISHH